MKKINIPELLSPVSNFISLKAAIDAGADAVYFGIRGLNMRARSKNFELKDLKKIKLACKKNNVKTFLALNTIIYENEITKAEKILTKAKKEGIDAVILWDMAVLKIAKRIGMTIHLSTQASVSNSLAAQYYRNIGVKRIVLARECNLKQIKKIKSKSDVEIEIFAHGAMCVAVSGRCFMSHHLFKKSANRGECIQPCRREYIITDPEDGNNLILGKDYVMSPKDLCTINVLDKICDAGIDCIKIEGRMRKPEYVFETTKAYRKALDLIKSGLFTEKAKKDLINDLKKVYNRGFSNGFLIETPDSKDFCDVYGSKSTELKQSLGYVVNFYNKIGVAEIKIESGILEKGDTLMIQGNKTGVIKAKADSIEKNHKKILKASKGERVSVKLTQKVRENDRVYIIRSRISD